MKVTNWCKKLMASIVAGGALVPGICHAVDIPVGDANFETYVVPARGYAYAADPFGAYRVSPPPISPWVDDLDNPLGFVQDDGVSSWLYNAAYAENTTNSRRASPRSGTQAMHGLDGSFNAQELANVFEADKTYTFSVWGQNDEILNDTNGIGLYVFDGNVAFSPANALNSANFTTTVPKRAVGMTAAQSAANWAKFQVRHTVFAGDPAVGHPIGVGFRAFRDSAVDDAALTSDPAQNFVMILEVNTTNGQVRVRNLTGSTVNIDYYEIKSTAGALNAVAWNSLQEQNLAGFPAGNGSGNGWEQAGGSNSTVVSESYLTGSSGVSPTPVGLGAAYTLGGAHDIIFKYGQLTGPSTPADGDYNHNGVVDAGDYVLWRKGGPLQNDPTPGVQPGDYAFWRARFGNTAVGPSGPSTLIRGMVSYVTSFSGFGSGSAVPEPGGVILVGMGIAILASGTRRRTAAN